MVGIVCLYLLQHTKKARVYYYAGVTDWRSNYYGADVEPSTCVLLYNGYKEEPMNKRLQELAREATFGRFNEHNSEADDASIEKFAELIVKDCVNVCRQEWYRLNNNPKVDTDPRAIGIRIGQKNGVLNCISNIKTLFGVKE